MTVYELNAYELKNIQHCLNFQIELANDNKFVKKGRISYCHPSQTPEPTENELQNRPSQLENIREEEGKTNVGGDEELKLE